MMTLIILCSNWPCHVFTMMEKLDIHGEHVRDPPPSPRGVKHRHGRTLSFMHAVLHAVPFCWQFSEGVSGHSINSMGKKGAKKFVALLHPPISGRAAADMDAEQSKELFMLNVNGVLALLILFPLSIFSAIYRLAMDHSIGVFKPVSVSEFVGWFSPRTPSVPWLLKVELAS